ncbi:MAG: glutamate--tRNA ligase [Clostridium sp.]|nr:glutamate--tRNA ligase [Clostridium sp.]MCM1443961.1 glutamate--tRNA ligase [Candidatus Amulumruptor caecigallinarius]
MTNKDLANLIFPNVTKTIEDYEKMYPKRDLNNTSCITRFAPSPTGYMHLGGFFQALIDYNIAKNSNGIFYLRNEDTDQKREVEDAVELIMKTLKQYDILPDEYEYKGETVGKYGPYIQSERKEIYHTFIKHLIEIGRAYPCFCSKEEIDEMRSLQEERKMRSGYYGRFARCNGINTEDAINRIKNGESYVIRFRSNGNFDNKIIFEDLVKGRLNLNENDIDDVIMKSDNLLPTYHFAHIVDDYLMHTTHVVRGEEWLPSVPKHIQMFEAFGFTPPKYIHTPLIVKKEGNSVRKISKRKDPEASMSYYEELGYPRLAVIEALMTIINSNYEAWHTENPDKSFIDFEFNPKKMSSSGALFDLGKLDNISKEIISKMTAKELYNDSYEWSKKYSETLRKIIESNPLYYEDILNIEREKPKPRKDIAHYSDIENLIWYMYDDIYFSKDLNYEWQKITDKQEIKRILKTYIDKYYNVTSQEEWFNNVKALCDNLGYASNMKEYKQNPENFKGNVADISTVLRVALTTLSNTPDLFEIMRLFGIDRVKNRYEKLIENL